MKRFIEKQIFLFSKIQETNINFIQYFSRVILFLFNLALSPLGKELKISSADAIT
jgi:hypothetical protein